MNEKTKTYTKEELDQMPSDEMINVMLKATKIEGKGVVRRADGTIKYDKPERKGAYGEDDAV
jgi:hypothetical protein